MGSLQETMMIEIKVPDMTCGHCASTITKAVKELDPAAKLDISLAEHLVKVDSGAARNDILHAISEAGYTPEAA
jgi:copper chaperone